MNIKKNIGFKNKLFIVGTENTLRNIVEKG